MAFTGRSKYGAKKTACSYGHEHDSKKEARRCTELCLLAKAGEIRKLEFQPKFHFVVKQMTIVASLAENIVAKKRTANATDVAETRGSRKYVADFKYEEYDKASKSWRLIVEDVKSPSTRTPVYQLKKWMLKACYGLEIRESI